MSSNADRLLTPKTATLAQYGMDERDFRDLAVPQGWACGVCGNLPDSGRLFIDHEHVVGWKKMPPQERRKYIRGLACYRCNRFILNARITFKLLRLAADYLERYERAKELGGLLWPRK